jgi:hypothetical protein
MIPPDPLKGALYKMASPNQLYKYIYTEGFKKEELYNITAGISGEK